MLSVFTFLPNNNINTALYTRNTTSIQCPVNGILYMKNCIGGSFFLGELVKNDFIKLDDPSKYNVILSSGSMAYVKFDKTLLSMSPYNNHNT